MASCGDLNAIFFPSISTSPSYPPVLVITGIPKRIFINVDFPAPFSPISACISPFLTSKSMPLNTLFP